MKENDNLSKRGKKGGARFPRYSLVHLDSFLQELVSKTHTNTISLQQLNAGVFKLGTKSATGDIKCSALKQFNLIEGDSKKLKATELCSKIAVSEGDEKLELFREAFMKVGAFKNIIETYQNSNIEKQKISQYAVGSLKVHPDMKDEFVKVLLESAQMIKFCTVNGNTVAFINTPLLSALGNEDKIEDNNDESDNESTESYAENKESNFSGQIFSQKHQGQVSNINVNLDIDPSMDPEKLEKLLKLLKNYGAI